MEEEAKYEYTTSFSTLSLPHKDAFEIIAVESVVSIMTTLLSSGDSSARRGVGLVVNHLWIGDGDEMLTKTEKDTKARFSAAEEMLHSSELFLVFFFAVF